MTIALQSRCPRRVGPPICHGKMGEKREDRDRGREEQGEVKGRYLAVV